MDSGRKETEANWCLDFFYTWESNLWNILPKVIGCFSVFWCLHRMYWHLEEDNLDKYNLLGLVRER